MSRLNWFGISAVIAILAATVLVRIGVNDEAQILAILAIALAVLSLHQR